jgi:DNA-binding MarR family transcriptional regulator
MNTPNEVVHSYLERFGKMWEQTGLTHIGGKILGYLLICDKDIVSFQELVENLNVSKASVSNNIKALLKIQFIEKVALEDSRKTHYRVQQVNMVKIMQERLKLFVLFSDIMEEGIEIKANKRDAAAYFMQDAADFYRWFAEKMPLYLNDYEKAHQKINNADL